MHIIRYVLKVRNRRQIVPQNFSMRIAFTAFALIIQLAYCVSQGDDMFDSVTIAPTSTDAMSLFEKELMISCPISKGPSAVLSYLDELEGYSRNEELDVGFGIQRYDAKDAIAYGLSLVDNNSHFNFLYDVEDTTYNGWLSFQAIYSFKNERDKTVLYDRMIDMLNNGLRLPKNVETDISGQTILRYKLTNDSQFSIKQESNNSLHTIDILWALDSKTSAIKAGLDAVSSGLASDFVSHEEESFRIDYPANWLYDNSGMGGSTFIIFSPQSGPADRFSDNVNLLIQDLTGLDETLDTYAKKADSQLISLFGNETIVSSEKITKENLEYHKVVFVASQGTLQTKHVQYSFIVNSAVHVLTLTCEAKEFESYEKVGTAIMDSFRIK